MKQAEINKTAELLSKLEPGFLPLNIFTQIARLIALPILEVVPLRKTDDKIEVLLLKRSMDDDLWPGLLHSPGTVIRATDVNNIADQYYQPFMRIFTDELKNTKIGKPYFVGSNLIKSKRGVEHAQIYWVEVLGKNNVGQFYQVDKLPTNIIESQIKFIELATKSFLKINN